MATFDSSIYTGQSTSRDGTDLHADGSVLAAQQPVCQTDIPVTTAGTEAAADDIRLWRATEDIEIIPEECRVGSDSTTDIDCDFILEKVDSAGTVTALTGAASLDTLLAQGTAFSRLLALGRPTVSKGDYIQATLSNATAVPAAEELWFKIKHVRVNHN